MLLALLVFAVAAAPTLGDAGLESDAGPRPGSCPDGVLRAHAPITIGGDADFTAANGVTGGSGTAEDPYVIACWSIQVSARGVGVRVGTNSAGPRKAFVVRDVMVTGPGRGVGQFCGQDASCGVWIRRAESATVHRVGAVDLDGGIVTDSVATLVLRENLVEGDNYGIWDRRSPDVTIVGNLGRDNGDPDAGNGACIVRDLDSGGDLALVVQGNRCLGGAHDGFSVRGNLRTNGIQVGGNVAEGFGGTGIVTLGAGVVAGNVARRNGTGFAPGGGETVQGNIAERNADVGIDVGGCFGCVIRDNTIEGNGSAGILSFFAFPTSPRLRAWIEGNHIGGNPFGIVLQHGTNSSVVQGTDWTDGRPSFVRGEDLSTILDAGSDQRGIACGPGEARCEPVRFHDYVATASLASGQDVAVVAAVTTDLTWDFGDGTQPVRMAPDPLGGHAAPPEVSHVYVAPGAYVATLSMTVMDNTGGSFVLRDTTHVWVQQGD